MADDDSLSTGPNAPAARAPAAVPPDATAALAQAITALAAAINNMPAGNAAAVPAPEAAAPPDPAVLDPFTAPDAFDLSSRAGSVAFATASAKLDETWDGHISSFPAFLIALRIRASEANWNAAAPQGIVTINGHNLLTDYHSVTDVDIIAARDARTNARAIQNARAMYHCLKKSITGDLRSTIFEQVENLPAVEDGLALFKRLTTFTMTASLQLSLQAFEELLSLDPSKYEFNVSKINTHLNHLFVLATTRDRTLHQNERIQHTLAVYNRIQQPELWAQWVRNQMDDFDSGRITNCQDFMNSAVLKYNKIIGTSKDGFNGSTNTLQEDIVAMLSSTKKRKAASGTPTATAPEGSRELASAKKQPPFLKHYKVSQDPDSPAYKVGDSKVWQGTTWYFCDCPLHRDKAKWHTHPADKCRLRKKWLASKENPSDKDAAANVADDSSATTDPSTLTNPTFGAETTDRSDVTGLLANAFNLVGANDAAKELIAEALESLNEES